MTQLKKNIIGALLLTIGYVLHLIMPGILAGMRMDLLLAMMFTAILLFRDARTAITVGVLGGIITGLTSTLPGGLVANFVDKIITAFVVLLIIKLLERRISEAVTVPLVGFVGTITSGTICLGVALFFAELPFSALLATVVIPAAIANTIIVIAVQTALRLALGPRMATLGRSN